jgi:arsenate reductase
VKLSALIKKTGLRPIDVMRKADPAAKSLGLNAETPDEDMIAAMVANPGLIQRPILEIGDRALLARPIDKALELIR